MEAATAQPEAPTLDSPELFTNRELSWLQFNERVLELAEDESTPLLERVKFLAIYANNLDEFYMVRVAGLKAQQSTGIAAHSADGLTPIEQLALIDKRVRPMVERHAALFADDVMPGLAKEGVDLVRWKELDGPQRRELTDLFHRQIFPVVTPLAVDPGHPFPYISNLSLNLAVMVRDPSVQKVRFARLKVPPLLPRFISFSGGDGFVPIEDVIAANLERLFPGMEIVEHHAFRVTRNAD
ncbi:MAG: RNA degradosome polyphosphate kinase, partial [Pseudonocardiaceae bacterium]